MYTCPHCKDEFDIENAEDIRIFNANAKTLSVKCTACNKNFRLSKDDSKILFEKFPELEDELEKVKNEKITKEIDNDGVQVGDFEEKFRDALSIFGLDGKKYKNKIDAIVKLIERTGSTKEWLRYHMQRLSFTNQKTIESVVDLVYLDEGEQNQIPPFPSNYPGRIPGYNMQQLPGGQVILMPGNTGQQMPQGIQPIIIDRGGDRGERVAKESNDVGTIIEELDGEGKVIKRIIKGGPRPTSQVEKSDDGILKTITMLKELGIIPNQHQRIDQQPIRANDEIHDTLNQIKEAMVLMGSALKDKPEKPESEELKKMSATVNRLTEQLQQSEKEKRDNETKSIKDEMAQLKSMISNLSNRRVDDAPASGLSDVQFGTHTQHKNLETVTESVTHVGDKISQPLNEILKNQQKINSLLLIRDIEKQDGVVPGTYMKVMTPTATPGDDQVHETVNRWKEKAAAAKGAN